MKSKMSIITIVISCLIIFGYSGLIPLYSVASDSPAEEKIETWADNHPRAATELGEWVSTHREAAQAIFKWDSKHPEQSKSFVMWVISHLGKRIDVYTEEHADLRRFNKIVESHRDAVNTFVVWCRFHPKATAALMQHPGALHWIGQHVYKP
jgi:hypothetical protein